MLGWNGVNMQLINEYIVIGHHALYMYSLQAMIIFLWISMGMGGRMMNVENSPIIKYGGFELHWINTGFKKVNWPGTY